VTEKNLQQSVRYVLFDSGLVVAAIDGRSVALQVASVGHFVLAYFVQSEHRQASSSLEHWWAKLLSHYHYAVVVQPPDELRVKLPFGENYA